MKTVLITGATGTVGVEVIRNLSQQSYPVKIIAAVRNVADAKEKFGSNDQLEYRQFDLQQQHNHSKALQGVDIIFLLRPPQITDVKHVFKPFLEVALQQGIKKVVFLSVQGAESVRFIPHRKIEDLIIEMGFDYIFVRPGYFMQNLTAALLPEIIEKQKITLPAGDARFNWVDVRDIGKAIAIFLASFDQHYNKAFFINGPENLSFEKAANIITQVTGQQITYRSINPLSFYFLKRKQGLDRSFAIVMTLLHFIPRLQSEPTIHKDFELLTKIEPSKLIDFIEREKEQFL